MSESHGHTEAGHDSPTEASNSWLGNKLARWTGHALLTAGGELMTEIGMVTTPVGMCLTLATANPIFLTLAAPTAIGAAIGWQGAKHAGPIEQGSYVAIKTLAPASILAGPFAMSVMSKLSLVSTALAMRHRA